ncbi:MAG: LysR family transcriptional regulator [Clostridia bacterium]|nr:LysR family transcriptional regulator [Clostridia bacterium]
MELISLYYFTELAKDLHMTRTAERLFISQQTLSNHIARLEGYYGTTLFYRKPRLMLTPAGEYVLSSAKTILKEESNLKDILFDVEQQERGLLRFGASTLRMNTSLPRVLPRFSERYPKIELRLTDTISSELIELVLNGQLDLAVTVVKKEDPRLIETPLLDDQVYLCVSDVLLKQYYGEEGTAALKQKASRGASVADFSKLPFCLLHNRIGELIYECFAEANVVPWTYITSTYTSISAAICFDRLAAAFIPRVCLADLRGSIPEDINVFPMLYKGKPLMQQVYLIHMKDRYMPRPFRYFQTLLSEYYRDVECVGLERIV